jgi:hypothetical protein
MGPNDHQVVAVERMSADAVGLPRVNTGRAVAVSREAVRALCDAAKVIQPDAGRIVAEMVDHQAARDRTVRLLPHPAMRTDELVLEPNPSVALDQETGEVHTTRRLRGLPVGDDLVESVSVVFGPNAERVATERDKGPYLGLSAIDLGVRDPGRGTTHVRAAGDHGVPRLAHAAPPEVAGTGDVHDLGPPAQISVE